MRRNSETGANAPAGGGDHGVGGAPASSGAGGASDGAHLALVLVADVDLPGDATRFDYEDIDTSKGRLVIAHMNDASVVVVNLSDGRS